MKLLYLILFILLSLKCNLKKDNNSILLTKVQKDRIFEKSFDTIVVLKALGPEISISDYTKYEYFVIIKNDTSDYSCIISENKLEGRLSVDYRNTPYYKIFNSFLLADTATLDNKKSKKKFQETTTQKEQISELRLIVKNMARQFNLSKLKYFSFSLSAFQELTLKTTKQYKELYGEKFSFKSNKEVVNLIQKSELIYELNSIMSTYSLIISKTSIDGLVYYKPIEKNKTHSEITPILDGRVIFTISEN